MGKARKGFRAMGKSENVAKGRSPERTRENIVGRREEVATGREKLVGRREEVAKGREKLVGKREKIKKGEGREGMALGREKIVGGREEVATGREKIVGGREEVATGRENAEERYTVLFKKAVDAIFIADPKTQKIVDCNKAAEKLTGYSRHKILSMRISELYPKDKAKETTKAFEEQVKGKIKTFSTELFTKNNKRIPVEINAANIIIGNKTYVQGIFRDISKQMKAETRLKESEARYLESFTYTRSLIEASLDPFVTISPNGTITDANVAALRIRGVTKKEIIGSHFSKYFTDPKKAKAIYLYVLKNGFIKSYPLTIL